MNLSPIMRTSNMVMIFDVETNGLLNGRNIPKLEECPYILQLSYILYDLTHNRIVKTFDTYVKIPQNIEISAIITSINGITKEKCNTVGSSMIDILQEFYKDYHMCSMLIAHNYQFDSAMINIEFQRHWNAFAKTNPYSLNLFHPVYMKSINMRYKCTMKDSTNICKIEHVKKVEPPVNITSNLIPSVSDVVPSSISPLPLPPSPLPPSPLPPSPLQSSPLPQLQPSPSIQIQKPLRKPSYKWPSLTELHRHLFNSDPNGMHNSMMDILVTLRCFLALENKQSYTDSQFNDLKKQLI